MSGSINSLWLAFVALASARTINWSGYTWTVRTGTAKSGPGPNYWTDDVNSVYVDNNGALHLTIKYLNNSWYCTEIYLNQQLGKGYGTYQFDLGQAVDSLGNGDVNVVLGLFIYQDDNHEIDVEFSRWGDPTGPNADYCNQPSTDQSCLMWTEPKGINASTHTFDWQSGKISFASNAKGNSTPFQTWTYTGTSKSPVPTANALYPHLNLWLMNGKTAMPTSYVLDVVITGFHYINN